MKDWIRISMLKWRYGLRLMEDIQKLRHAPQRSDVVLEFLKFFSLVHLDIGVKRDFLTAVAIS